MEMQKEKKPREKEFIDNLKSLLATEHHDLKKMKRDQGWDYVCVKYIPHGSKEYQKEVFKKIGYLFAHYHQGEQRGKKYDNEKTIRFGESLGKLHKMKGNDGVTKRIERLFNADENLEILKNRLRYLIVEMGKNNIDVDWVQLTIDMKNWKFGEIGLKWAEDFYGCSKESNENE